MPTKIESDPDSSEEERVPVRRGATSKPKARSSKSSSRRKSQDSESESSEEEKITKKTKKPAKSKVELDEESEEEKPKKKAVAKKAARKKVEVQSDSEQSEEEKPKKTTAKKTSAKKSKVAKADSKEDKPKKKTVTKKVAAKKESEQSDSEEEKSTKTTRKPQVTEDSEEESKPKKKPASKKPTTKKETTVSDEEEKTRKSSANKSSAKKSVSKRKKDSDSEEVKQSTSKKNSKTCVAKKTEEDAMEIEIPPKQETILLFPDDIWKIILNLCAASTWPYILQTCKKIYSIALPLFLDQVFAIANTTDFLNKNQRKIASLFHLKNLYKLVDKGIQDSIVSFSGTIESIPWIEADGVTVMLPLVEAAVTPLLKKSEMTPFGKGKSTLVDKNIRSGWQISGTKINIRTSNWINDDMIKTIVNELLPKNRIDIKVELDKLLIYGPGDKFKAHKDTIRGKDHIGSLVIFLPSIYEGGELVIRYRKSEQMYQYSQDPEEPLKCNYVVFFTDVEHEVLPVKSGYRVTLTYHLFKREDSDSDSDIDTKPVKKTISLPANYDIHSKIFEALFKANLEHQKANSTGVTELGIIFSHFYSEATLSPSRLKGKDRSLYNIFSECPSLQIELVLIRIELQGQLTGRERDRVTRNVSKATDVSNIVPRIYWHFIDIEIKGGRQLYYENMEEEEECNTSCRFIQPLDEMKIHNSYDLVETTLGNVGEEREYYRYTSAAMLVSKKE